MKIFFIGLAVGIVIGIVGIVLLAYYLPDHNRLVLFPQEGGCITNKPLVVLEVLGFGKAIVEIKSNDSVIQEPSTLLLMDDNKTYYDGEIIEIPAGKCARQIGTYRYVPKGIVYRVVPGSKFSKYKTVPVVRIEDI